ncbi:hypothetical protein RJ639_009020 [Escallonia herrerae]|uniref:Uncharacterized protein n=1 Tax=Escallonia herrerae TaxID=1293975 RepID=A0AA88VSD8_9ASTE|nr:hypothetical protein RJ639_009020 [Escallonia herrerae]
MSKNLSASGPFSHGRQLWYICAYLCKGLRCGPTLHKFLKFIEESHHIHVAAAAVSVSTSPAFVLHMAEPIAVLICSLLAPMASATFAHSAATRAAAEATTASLLVVFEGPSCFEFSAAAIAAKAAATPATDIAACTSALCNLWSSFRFCLISLSHFFIETCLNVTMWTVNGEGSFSHSNHIGNDVELNIGGHGAMHEMVNDLFTSRSEDPCVKVANFYKYMSDADRPLYFGNDIETKIVKERPTKRSRNAQPTGQPKKRRLETFVDDDEEEDEDEDEEGEGKEVEEEEEEEVAEEEEKENEEAAASSTRRSQRTSAITRFSHVEINEQHNVKVQTDATIAAITDPPNNEDEALYVEMTSHLQGSQINPPSTEAPFVLMGKLKLQIQEEHNFEQFYHDNRSLSSILHSLNFQTAKMEINKDIIFFWTQIGKV